jgi:tetratricopeptide (TPR) repeat protein
MSEFERQIAELDRIIAEDPTNPMHLCRRASLLGDHQQHERAIEDLTEALRLDPNLGLAYRRRGELRRELGKNVAAIADLRHALSLEPSSIENHWVHRDLGIAYSEISDHEAAVASYDRSIDLTKSALGRSDHDAIFLRAISYRALRRYDEAIRDFSIAIKEQPNVPWNYTQRGWTWMASGDFEKAHTDIDAALRLYPTDPLPKLVRGLIHLASSSNEKAIKKLSSSLRGYSRNAQCLYARALAYERLGDNESAAIDRANALALDSRVESQLADWFPW